MAICISRIPNFNWPDPIKIEPDHINSWKLYMIEDTDKKPSQYLYSDINSLDYSDKNHAKQGLVKFAKIAQTGVELTSAYDAKQCHEAHQFSFNKSTTTVWRIRKEAIRIYFCYIPNRCIGIIKIDSKRANKLTNGEKLELETMAELLLKNTINISIEVKK
jgi:hypothetical protein